MPAAPIETADGLDGRSRVLAAVLELAELTGLRKLSMDEVARRARVSRATLYTYFAGREALLAAVAAAELSRLTDVVTVVAARYDSADERLVHGFAAAYRHLRGHGPLSAIMRINPEILMPYVISDRRETLDLGSALLQESLRLDDIDPASGAALAEHMTRLLHTLVLIPSTTLGLQGIDGPELFARTFLLPVKHHLRTVPFQPGDS